MLGVLVKVTAEQLLSLLLLFFLSLVYCHKMVPEIGYLLQIPIILIL